ncbi:MAG: hypothetical protein ACRDTG_22505 [Pseudonocardiaceae bacterium]
MAAWEVSRLASTPTMAELLERADRRRARSGGASRAATEAAFAELRFQLPPTL